MSLATDFGIKAAKAGVSAARKSASRVVQRSQKKAGRAVDSSGRTLDSGLDYVERALHDGLDAIAERGRQAQSLPLRYLPDRFQPRPRRGPPVATALTGLGAGVLLALLFARRGDGAAPGN
ncbi:hypothetical protein ACO2Q3_02310 [Caulobacter sp. KR2-114]|uniref:hypothetical protein n=1 Tax=Caulobacter sp. KR2-114 TaxID=3400912 RepID=UPI003C1157A5